MKYISALLRRWRTASVRRWVQRQEASGVDPSAYEILAYIRSTWHSLTDEDARALMRTAMADAARFE